MNEARAASLAAVRVAVRASGLELPPWQAEIVRRMRAMPGVEVLETHEPQPLLPADVFLDPSDSTRVLTGDLPRLGHWRFIYGEEGRLTQPCAHEHTLGKRCAMVRLVSFSAGGRVTQLECGVIKTVTHSLSATRERMFDAVVDWPARALRRILNDPLQQIRGPLVPNGVQSHAPLPHVPFPTLRGYVRRFAQESIEEHWALGIIHKPVHHVVRSFDANDIQWLAPPRHGAIADPLGALERNGRLTILAEGYGFDDRQGRIVALEVESGRVVAGPREVLRLAVHASYPHLITHGTQIYCLPEAAASGCVQLYRADPFPGRWVPDRILLQSFAGADATVHRHAGRWWMFVGNHADQDETKLYVFHAPDLFGTWKPHALNPVKCDLRSARSAGPLFEHEGALYRPAQDGSATYGGAVAVNRVIALSPTEFAEETVTVLRPARGSPYPHGLHTLTGVGSVTLVDGKRHARSFRRLAWGLKQMARGSR